MEGRWTLEALVSELGVPRSTLKHRIAQLNIAPVARGARAKLYYGELAREQLMEAGKLIKEGLDLPDVRKRLGLPDESPTPEVEAGQASEGGQAKASPGPGGADWAIRSLDDMARAIEQVGQSLESALAQLAAKDQHIARLSEALTRNQEQGASHQAKAFHLQAELVRVNKELDDARRLLAQGGGGGSLLKRLWGPKDGTEGGAY